MRRDARSCACVASLVLLAGVPAGAAWGWAVKPERTEVTAAHEPGLISVKLREGLAVRVREGRLVAAEGAGDGAADAGTLAQLNAAPGVWERAFTPAEDRLEAFTRTAEANLGVDLPDLNLHMVLRLQGGVDAGAACDALNRLDAVELAQPWPRPVAAPLPGDFRPRQTYLNAAPAGTASEAVWDWPGGRGQQARIADLEYSWNLNHQDLPTVTLIPPAGVDPFGDTNHGTAVLGQLVSLDNGWGTTGGAPLSPAFVAATYNGSSWNVGDAVLRAAAVFQAGDVILIEQQTTGPNATGGSSQFGLVPVEWFRPWYDAIRATIGNNIFVVMAAGNGSQNLDDAVYSTGNGGHWPFLPQNDSGAIIVGAGGPPTGSSAVPRSRLSFSNWGSRLNLQGHGTAVTTTGYGGLYSAGGTNLLYTATFGGTSSASPIVTNAVAQASSVMQTVTGAPPTPAALRAALVATGVAQQSGQFPATQRIGPQPDARAAIARLLGDQDCNANGVPDRIEVFRQSVCDFDGNGVPDVCQSPRPCRADVNDDCAVDFNDLLVFLNWFNTSDARADFNGDGAVDFNDVLEFLNLSNAGC